MTELYKTKKVLTNENIVLIISELSEIYSEYSIKRSVPKKKFTLSAEEAMLRFRDYYGTEKPCTIIFGKYHDKYTLDISQEGSRNELSFGDNDMQMSYDLLSRLGVYPRYLFSRSEKGPGTNHYICEFPKKKLSILTVIVIAAVVAIIAGIIILKLPDGTQQTISNDLVTPIFKKLTAIFSAIATPLVFLAVISGITGIGSIKDFGDMGSRVLKRMSLSYVIAGIITAVTVIFTIGLSKGAADTGDTSALGRIVTLVLDIIPDNLFSPFSHGNDLQVIVIAIFVGIALLIMGKKALRLNEIINEAAELINTMMTICCSLLPVVVFFGIVNIIVTSNAKQFEVIGKMFVVFMLANAVFIPLMYIRTRIVTKVPLKSIVPKQMATLLINLATSSQVAALSENLKCCKEKFGIDSKLVDFSLPLGIVVYMPSGSIYLSIMVFELLALFGLPISIGVLIRVIVICTIVAIAAPPIPGSALVVTPILFAACGVPQDAFPLAVICGTIIGYLLPAMNGINIQLEVLMTAKKLGKVDETTLRTPYKKK